MYKFPNSKQLTLLLLFMGGSSAAFAAGPPKPDSISNPVVLTLVFIMAILLLAIILLGNILVGATQYKYDLQKKAKDAARITGGTAMLLLALVPFNLMAQDGTAEAVTEAPSYFIPGVSNFAVYTMLGVIAFELLVIFIMLLQLRTVIKTAKQVEVEIAGVEVGKASEPTFKEKLVAVWNKINSFRSKEQEADLLLDHDYDGIKELDNRLPPWWLYGFYFTIAFSAVYLWIYHVSGSAPLSAQEFQIAWEKGERQVEEYLKNAAANVDENTVTLITDEAQLKAAQALFQQNCQACHGAQGEGNAVGPNLTDKYWLHGGSLSDIFKSIKYGWPDKGMKSWKDDFSPVQIAQLASYIKSIQGIEHANPKGPQGELYEEPEETATDNADQETAQ